jgi:hypothetical protein
MNATWWLSLLLPLGAAFAVFGVVALGVLVSNRKGS